MLPLYTGEFGPTWFIWSLRKGMRRALTRMRAFPAKISGPPTVPWTMYNIPMNTTISLCIDLSLGASFRRMYHGASHEDLSWSLGAIGLAFFRHRCCFYI